MSNLAAILATPKTPLEIHPVPKYTPGPTELLIRNECIALNPIEAKIAVLNVIPYTPYLAILGSTYGGTIQAVGSQVQDWSVGERVVVSKRFGVKGNQYGAFQRYVVCADRMVSRVPAGAAEEEMIEKMASVMMNLTCVVGLFTGRLELERPPLEVIAETKEKKILVYGGSSSFGGLSEQYLSQAGYQVITTSSSRSFPFVSTLGAAEVVDHTQDPSTLTAELIAQGPYNVVVDFVSIPATISVTAAVLAAQGGGRLFTMQPGREELPANVERVFEPYSESLYEPRNKELLKWVVDSYLPRGIKMGLIKPMPVDKVSGGLFGINQALVEMVKGRGRKV
ncbi:GroES-like protein [Bimuria novae-zelandiae CBS 107.79]|uniref:GroES-like protein n=1 Tax=Bimuria novae-zelandiae CBS 107.79 TaxID=1447943 RepID=A0A6A5VPG7_9PLEO|nr:GroES-like protein [Bimuria novae-zelandiae CBS 107.79]